MAPAQVADEFHAHVVHGVRSHHLAVFNSARQRFLSLCRPQVWPGHVIAILVAATYAARHRFGVVLHISRRRGFDAAAVCRAVPAFLYGRG